MRRYFSISEAKARFCELIRIARFECEVIITDRSKPVARMVSVEAKVEPKRKPGVLEDRLIELEKSGALSPRKTIPYLPKQIPLPASVLKKFLNERE